jgi:hypothetical protein
MKKENDNLNNNIIFDKEALAFAIAERNIKHKNENKCLRKNHKRWLKILELEQAEQNAATLIAKGIDYDTISKITGLTFNVIQLIANNFSN